MQVYVNATSALNKKSVVVYFHLNANTACPSPCLGELVVESWERGVCYSRKVRDSAEESISLSVLSFLPTAWCHGCFVRPANNTANCCHNWSVGLSVMKKMSAMHFLKILIISSSFKKTKHCLSWLCKLSYWVLWLNKLSGEIPLGSL